MSILSGNPRRHHAHRRPLPEREARSEGALPSPPVERSPTPAAAVRPAAPDFSQGPEPGTTKKGKATKRVLSPAEKRKRYLKWAFWIAVIVILWFAFGWLKAQALILLQQNPTIWAIYLKVAAEIEARSLLGLFYASSFGALFFITLPVEIIFLYYLGLNYYFVQVLVITLLGNLLGIAFNYFCGWLVGPKVLGWFMKKETYAKFHQKIEKAGAFIVIVGNIIPFPIEPFTVFLGALRYGFVRLMLYTAIGKIVKFGLLWLGYTYFVRYLAPYISQVNLPWFLSIIKSGFGG